GLPPSNHSPADYRPAIPAPQWGPTDFTRTTPYGASEEDRAPRRAVGLDHRRDALPHHGDLRFDDDVVGVRIALEPKRLAEADAVTRGERQREAEKELRDHGERRHPDERPETLEVGDRDVLLLGTDDGDGHDRRTRLEREA